MLNLQILGKIFGLCQSMNYFVPGQQIWLACGTNFSPRNLQAEEDDQRRRLALEDEELERVLRLSVEDK